MSDQARTSELNQWQQRRVKQLLIRAVPEKKFPLTWEYHPEFGRALLNADEMITILEDNVQEWERVRLESAAKFGRDAIETVHSIAKQKREQLSILRSALYTCFRLAAESAEGIEQMKGELEAVKEQAVHPERAIREIHSMMGKLLDTGEQLTYRQMERYVKGRAK
jgi:hypothetical protein